MLCLTRNLHVTGKIVVLGSGLCSLQGLVEIKKKGIYGSALFKKKRYWSRYTNGDNIKLNFANKDVRYIDALWNELENMPLCAFAIKEEYYVMMLMSTYGTYDWVDDDKFRTIGGYMIGIKYAVTVQNHYQRIYDME